MLYLPLLPKWCREAFMLVHCVYDRDLAEVAVLASQTSVFTESAISSSMESRTQYAWLVCATHRNMSTSSEPSPVQMVSGRDLPQAAWDWFASWMAYGFCCLQCIGATLTPAGKSPFRLAKSKSVIWGLSVSSPVEAGCSSAVV